MVITTQLKLHLLFYTIPLSSKVKPRALYHRKSDSMVRSTEGRELQNRGNQHKLKAFLFCIYILEDYFHLDHKDFRVNKFCPAFIS